ncbi:HAD-IC family P-type ATPase [Demequina gelatinilytica]|uniref:HAD-IC family P-type ATPase n=1 Tax=Demequina gelatinilytica TaxID=1638980 RepID=UPI000782BBBE|nr:HAD-IC family P-type ATPase [Demequina gelatinilytica]
MVAGWGEAHHGIAAQDVLALLEADRDRGLGEDEAARRLGAFGRNALPDAPGPGVVMRILLQFHHPLVYVLLAAAAITLLLGEVVDCAVIMGVVLVNAAVGFVQERKAEAALQGLRSMVRTRARVVRDGAAELIDSEEVVPGDLVLLEAGDRAAADLRIVRCAELAMDESALTGESVPAQKEDLTLPVETIVADRRNMIFAGTLVTAGTGTGVVVATGEHTELGEIHRLVGAGELLATPLTRKLARFSRDLTVVILALAAATFGAGWLHGQDLGDTFTAAVALAVGAIPEGLPAAITIVMAIGVTRMARRGAVIRRLPAAETLGSTTVICSDKTGTLTENQMTVHAIWVPEIGELAVSGAGYAADRGSIEVAGGLEAHLGRDGALRWSILVAAACNDAGLHEEEGRWSAVGDPTEAALLVVAAKAGLHQRHVKERYPRVATIAFDSRRQYMATLHVAAERDASHVVLAKGAAERIVSLCAAQLEPDGTLAALDTDAIEAAVASLSQRGLRVLATAVLTDVAPSRFSEEALEGSLVFTGLHGMWDPPRVAAVDAVRACRTAGIDVKMITGDHAETAWAVARRVGLVDDAQDGDAVLTGPELARLDPDSRGDAVARATVLARVSPEQKLRLVESLQARGHVVAMTGDGVNDAPALRHADIGIAMGRIGTEVAKDAADVVLTDDNFATIEAAVEEGRGIFDNLTKFITWTLPTNLAEGLVILIAILLGTALPIQPTQILWINMTTAVALGLMLAFEPKERGIMTRPPRDPRQALLTPTLMARIVLVSAILVGGSWWLFEWEVANGASLAEARTVAANLFVAVEAFYLLNCRSLEGSVWRIGLLSNPWVVVGIAVQACAQALFTYLPVMNRVFGTVPIGGEAWVRILAVGALASLVVGAEKWIRARARRAAPPVP